MAPAEPAIWIDGAPGNHLPLPDRGLDFGDGVFETLLLLEGRPRFPDQHFERLQAGAARLDFPPGATEYARQCMDTAIAQLDPRWAAAALRLTLSRGGGPRGYTPPDQCKPRVVISASPLAADPRAFPQPISVGDSSVRWGNQPLLAGIKHLNRLEQVLASMEAKKAGLSEAIMLDAEERVCSLIAANLFMVEGEELITPPVDHCGVAGTRRRMVIEHWAPESGLKVREATFGTERLRAADEVFCCNSLRGIQPVGAMPQRQWQQFPVARHIHSRYVASLSC